MNTDQQDLVEQFEKQRTRLLKLQLVGYILGFGTWTLKHFLPHPYDLHVTPIILLGGLIWMLGQWRMLKYWQRLKRQPSLEPMLNDELIVSYRFKAFAVGFAAMMLTQGLIAVWSSFWPFSALLGANLSIFVGVVASMLAFLIYDRP